MAPFPQDSPEHNSALVEAKRLLPGIDHRALSQVIMDESVDVLKIPALRQDELEGGTVTFGDGEVQASFHTEHLREVRQLTRSGGYIYSPFRLLIKVS